MKDGLSRFFSGKLRTLRPFIQHGSRRHHRNRHNAAGDNRTFKKFEHVDGKIIDGRIHDDRGARRKKQTYRAGCGYERFGSVFGIARAGEYDGKQRAEREDRYAGDAGKGAEKRRHDDGRDNRSAAERAYERFEYGHIAVSRAAVREDVARNRKKRNRRDIAVGEYAVGFKRNDVDVAAARGKEHVCDAAEHEKKRHTAKRESCENDDERQKRDFRKRKPRVVYRVQGRRVLYAEKIIQDAGKWPHRNKDTERDADDGGDEVAFFAGNHNDDAEITQRKRSEKNPRAHTPKARIELGGIDKLAERVDKERREDAACSSRFDRFDRAANLFTERCAYRRKAQMPLFSPRYEPCEARE